MPPEFVDLLGWDTLPRWLTVIIVLLYATRNVIKDAVNRILDRVDDDREHQQAVEIDRLQESHEDRDLQRQLAFQEAKTSLEQSVWREDTIATMAAQASEFIQTDVHAKMDEILKRLDRMEDVIKDTNDRVKLILNNQTRLQFEQRRKEDIADD